MVSATAGVEAESEAAKAAESNAVEVMVSSCHPAKTTRIVRMN